MDMSLSELRELVMDREAWQELWFMGSQSRTLLSDWTEMTELSVLRVLGWNLKNDKMICVRFQGKPLNITIIQIYAPTINAKQAEVEQFYDDLQDLLELTPKMMPFSS